MYTFNDSFKFSFQDLDKWEIRGTIEDICELEEAERMVISDEEAVIAFYQQKTNRAQRIINKRSYKAKDRVKTLPWQSRADKFKATTKKQGYSLKYKGQTRKACAIVPPDSLGWDKANLSIMGKKTYGIKVGYIFYVT